MILAENFWLRGKAAQSSMMQLWAYNAAFAGTATIQAWKMGLSAPTGFWQAMARAGADSVPPDAIVTLPKPKKGREEDSPRHTAGCQRDGEIRGLFGEGRRFAQEGQGQTGARARSRARP
jgi:hypothetical protein